MNILLIIFAALFILLMIRGGRQGLLRMLFTLVSAIFLIVLIGFATPRIANYLQNNTQLYAKVETACVTKIEEHGIGDFDGYDTEKSKLALPGVLEKYLGNEMTEQIDETGEEMTQALTLRIAHVLGEKLARFIIAAIAFLIAVVAAIIIIRIIGGIFGLVNKIPVLGTINRVLGVIAGALIALIIVWLFMLFVSVCSSGDTSNGLMKMIADSPVLTYIYKHNLLANYISGGL